ncbi:prealbumin-like fold domain-containing protein [Gemmiger formicilis]|nr:prealbumin-like fold domain-containing protein [Gemmiger formicilis]
MARKNNEYTDYIYKNQYSAVAESRKLNGSKAWDGYYLSYAKGYLCDEVNHYKTLSYADESTYHIHAEQESQDEVLKSGFSLQKLVSTTGQPSPALKLEGAGFTVYRISKLRKVNEFKQNSDGSYDAASVLSAYRKDNYDNLTLKYDFTAEGQAIANMFESSTDTVNAYNATLTADGDYANGRGNGWMPTDQLAEYRLGEMFTNDEGIFRVEGLPYGQYLVVETTIPKDVFQCDPFIVTVDANSPQSRFTIPAGSVTTPSSDYMTYNILDEELEGYLQLIKIDTETGKAVKIANTSFALYKLDDKGNKTRISMIDPPAAAPPRKRMCSTPMPKAL